MRLENTYRVRLKIKDPKLARHIYRSLLPDTLLNPKGCSSKLDLVEHHTLLLKIECSRITLLRALTNSYFSIISMIKHLLEELSNESAANTA